MSDIGFYGLVAALVGLAMLALAVVSFLVEVVLWRIQQDRNRFFTLPRVAPLIYGALALGILYLTEEGPLSLKRALDDWTWAFAAAGLVLWGVLRIRFRKQHAHT